MRRIALQELSLKTVLLIGLLVTGLALLESWRGWIYAPFPIGHALLALLIPIWCKCLNLGNALSILRSHIRIVILFSAVALLFMGAYIVLYSAILGAFGRNHDSNWNLLATYELFGKFYISRYGRTTVLLSGYLLVGIWPMFGEEFFYRAFLFNGLMNHATPVVAAIVSSSLFGIRHAFQLAYFLPAYPAVSGAAYFIWAAGFGLLWSCVYYRTQSLWPCIAIHSANLVLAPLVLLIVKL